MNIVYVVRLRESLEDDVFYREYSYPRAFRLQASASDYIKELAIHLAKDGFKEVERDQLLPSSPIHNLKLQDDAGIVKLLTLCAWDYNDN